MFNYRFAPKCRHIYQTHSFRLFVADKGTDPVNTFLDDISAHEVYYRWDRDVSSKLTQH